MTYVIYKNVINGEKVICQNYKIIKIIDGVEYLTVHKFNNNREFLMRKDSLIKDDSIKNTINMNYVSSTNKKNPR